MTETTETCATCLILQDQRDRAWQHLADLWRDQMNQENRVGGWLRALFRRPPKMDHRFVDGVCLFCYGDELSRILTSDCPGFDPCRGLRNELTRVTAELALGKTRFKDLYDQHFVRGETHDRQLNDMRNWAGIYEVEP